VKRYSKKELEESRPNVEPIDAVNFCLRRLYADKAHSMSDKVVTDLTFEELIGTLLLARDVIKGRRTED
jgi:hypothetical protein